MFFARDKSNVLTLRILAYATEAEMLADTPLENTIGVETDSFDGYVFNATAPENPTVGLLWVQIDGDSPVKFTATRKKEIYLHPLKAYIYHTPKDETDTGWNVVVSHLYVNGKWNVFGRQYLYRDGNEYLELTADSSISTTNGWGCVGVPFSGTTGYSATVNRREDSLEVNITKEKVGTDSTIGTTLHCRKKIDLTNYKTLTFRGLFEYENANSNAYFSVWTELGETYQQNIVAGAVHKENNTADVVLDVSALKGEHEIGVGIRSCRLRLDECYLEM